MDPASFIPPEINNKRKTETSIKIFNETKDAILKFGQQEIFIISKNVSVLGSFSERKALALFLKMIFSNDLKEGLSTEDWHVFVLVKKILGRKNVDSLLAGGIKSV